MVCWIFGFLACTARLHGATAIELSYLFRRTLVVLLIAFSFIDINTEIFEVLVLLLLVPLSLLLLLLLLLPYTSINIL